MIKILRFANERYPWFLASTIGFIAITFIIGMGWCVITSYSIHYTKLYEINPHSSANTEKTKSVCPSGKNFN